MADDELELSPEHGLNPTIPVCFWCGSNKNEIALLGRVRTPDDDDAEAPMSMVLDYDPCDECKSKFDQGILFAEATRAPSHPNQPPLGDAYPTGRFIVLAERAVRALLIPDEMLDAVLEKRVACIEPDAFESIMLAADAAQGKASE